MIPKYLQGKSAVQIIKEQRERFIAESYNNVDERVRDRIMQLENMLLLAVKDALMNVDNGEIVVINGHLQDAEQRAIAFLNMVLPYKVEEE
jgi:predicted metal-dependent RNase